MSRTGTWDLSPYKLRNLLAYRWAKLWGCVKDLVPSGLQICRKRLLFSYINVLEVTLLRVVDPSLLGPGSSRRNVERRRREGQEEGGEERKRGREREGKSLFLPRLVDRYGSTFRVRRGPDE